MSALEKIDWGKLDGELYSVIAHASAGTDFCSPDLQLAVDGCIVEMKRALKTVGENGLPHNGDMVRCPTCGVACRVYSSGEGTNSFEPVTPYRAQHQ